MKRVPFPIRCRSDPTHRVPLTILIRSLDPLGPSFARKLVDSFTPNKVVDTSPQLIDAIAKGSEVLQEITDNFTPLMKRFCIFFFWEQHKTDLLATYDYVSRLQPDKCLFPQDFASGPTDMAARLWNKTQLRQFSTIRTGPAYHMTIEAYADSPRGPHLATRSSLRRFGDMHAILQA